MSENIISLNHVSFTYSESKVPAVQDVSFNVKKGEWFTILGNNGSGKSTITRLINGLLWSDENDADSIIVDGDPLNEQNLWKIRDKVGIVFQNPDNQFVGATVADDVAFGLENRGVPREQMLSIVDKAIQEVGMSDYKTAEPSNLSGGQKQRVAIAGILAVKPKILILDEATSMLDPRGHDEIISLVKKMKDKNDLTVISITHDINEIMLADHVLILNDGKAIAQGTPKDVFKNEKLIDSIGLEEPFIFKLIKKLIKAGIEIPENVDSQEKLVEILCQLNSKM
ncbi:energy-coupling factor transporter ATPase [Lactobacillus amylolyticus]|uniref:energy-coupling factor transporter ATPase n=1 Tax=Lactobacillus amylolyticus TaxID=83683 RepID=UPI0009BA7C1D|nr:energy-coupling factor transporter ATPase [Lactobacillus amylolyticus]ARD06389.1 energy-coupling factor transporter ATPase [Lactobacillus amylolyticus]